jgi:Icc-related predicted phosphoesterase
VDIAKLILSELKTFGKPVVTVPGTWDKELIEFLDKSGTSVHGKGAVIDGVGFYGFGGARTPFNTPYEPSEQEIESGLMKAYESVKKQDVLVQVSHAPPLNTALDIIFNGAHVGSGAVRKMIESMQPAVAICAHIHEAKGIDAINHTKVVNPGRFPEGNCALVHVEEPGSSARLISLI